MINTIDRIFDEKEKSTGLKYDRNNFDVREKLINNLYQKRREDVDAPPIDYLSFARMVDPNGAYSSAEAYKKAYGQNNEDIRGMEPEQIADYIYSKAKDEDKPLPEYAEYIFTMAPRYRKIFTPTSGKGLRTVPNFYSREELIELSGSATEDDPGGIETDKLRRVQTLAYNEAVGLEGMQNLATDFFSSQKNTPAVAFFRNFPGEKINFRKNPKTDEIEFFNPNLPQNIGLNQNDPEAVYQTLNTPGLDSGDFSSVVGDALVIGSEVAAALLSKGATLLANKRMVIGGETVSAGLGGAAGEIARIGLGNALYGEALVSQPETISLKSGLKALQTGAVNAIFTNAGKLIEDVVKGRFGKRGIRNVAKKFGPKDLDQMNLTAEEATELANTINKRLAINNASERLVYNVAEATDDVNLKMALAAYERQNVENMKEVMGDFKLEQALAYKKFWQTMNEEAFNYADMTTGNSILDEAYVGKKIKKLIDDTKLNAAENKAYKKLKISQANLNEPFKKIDPDVSKEIFTKTGVYIRNAVGMANKKLNDTYSKKFKNFGKRYNKVEVPLDGVVNLINTFKNRESAFKQFTNIESLFQEEFIQNPKLSLKSAMNTLSDMKTFLREIDQGLITSDSGVQVGQLKALVGKFEGGIKDALSKFGKQGDSRLVDEYNELITGYAQDKRALTRTLGDMIRLDNGVPKILDEDIFATTFKSFDPAVRNGQKARIDDTLNVIQDRPRIMQAYKKSVLTFYRRNVLGADGKPNLKKHENFMNLYEYPLKKVFGDEFKEIKKIGGLFKSVMREEKKAEELLKNMKKNTDLKVLNLNNKQIVDEVFDIKDLNTLKQVVNTLSTSKKDLKAFQKIIADKIERKSYEETQDGLNKFGGFNYQKFSNFISDKVGYGKALKIVFKDNPQYLEDLNTLKKAMKITSNVSKDGAEPKVLESALNHIIRSRIGIFTPEGRVFTAVVGMSQKAYQKRMAQLLSDPKAVNKLAQLNNIKIPKKYNTFEKIDNFLSTNQLYNELVTKTFGYMTGTYPIGIPDEKDIKREIERKTSDDKKVERDIKENKVSLISDEGMTGPAKIGTKNIFDADPERKLADATQPNINIFQPSEPQQIAAADLPVPAIAPTRASGIGALNPQAQAQNFAAIFPEDTIGQAIAQKGTKFG